MMGRKALVGKLFYQVSLEDLVPAEHLVRRVAAAVDFAVARRLTVRLYSHTSQPSVDPVVLFKMALLGYLYGLPSERRLVEEIRVNLAYRWLVGYDLDEAISDHSVLSKARRRFGPTVYEAFFTDVVRQCERAKVPADLYYKVHVGVDGGEARIITAVTATTGVVGDEQLLPRLVADHEGNTHRRALEVAADTKYGTVDNYRWLEERHVRAAIPFSDGKERRSLRRARCRGLDAVRIQALPTATAQNIGKLALRRPSQPTPRALGTATSCRPPGRDHRYSMRSPRSRLRPSRTPTRSRP